MQSNNLRRDQIASLLGLTLIILTISVAGAGYFTYLNLGKIVSQLETDNKPNKNLLLYKEIMVSLTGMENQVEFYQLTDESQYLDNYNDYTEKVSIYLDSINRINRNDKDLLVFNDSLVLLIDRKTEILNNLLKLNPENPQSDLTALVEKLEEIPKIVENKDEPIINELERSKELDSINASTAALEAQEEPKPEKEQGWLKKLFSGNKKQEKEEPVQPVKPIESSNDDEYARIASAQKAKDSLLAVKANEYRAELSNEIRKIKANSENAIKELKSREMALETTHFDIQNQIMDLITFLESRESLKLEVNTLKAKQLTSKTNNQILTFTILGTLLLLTSLIILLSYYNKSIKYQELLEEAKKSTETLAKAKERFFANMSHEIRTPMNAISGFTKILLKSPLNEDQREQVEIINKSSDHLLRLLNDVLDFSKLQANKLQLEYIPFDLEEALSDSIKLLKESAIKKGIHLNYDFSDLPKTVIGDPYRLRQILLNLLSNGIKFTENGEVKLTAAAKKQKDDVLVTFKVSDTGVGIPKTQQNRLFREFQQANQSSFSKGTGLGLAITKKLVLLHDQGKINLKSAEGKGTEITFTVRYEVSDKELDPTTAVSNKVKLGKLHVLIADDEVFNIKLLETLLQGHEITYDTAFDGNAALERLNKNTYDIVLLDLKMPGKSGWEVAEIIRSNQGPNQHKPFIALTATITNSEKEKGLKAGFDQILRKPFEENELIEAISKYTKVDFDASSKNGVDLSMLETMGDRGFVEEMVETFIRSAEGGMISLFQYLKDKDYNQMAITAHRIVAPARHFKAKELVKKLKDLEKRAESKDSSISQETLQSINKDLESTFKSLRDSLHKEIS